LVTYPGALHGFACADRPADYDAESAADAWNRVYRALEQHL
jgi:carboxymethylenebutenolidase